MDKFNKLFESKGLKIVILIIAIIAILLLVFQAGMFVGFRKASFSYGWGDNYYRTFGDLRRGVPGGFGPMMPQGLFHEDISSASGVAGKVISVSLPTLIVEGRDNIEKIVLIKDGTAVREFRDILDPADIKVGDEIIVIGEPNNQSQIEARLIRIIPKEFNMMPVRSKPLL